MQTDQPRSARSVRAQEKALAAVKAAQKAAHEAELDPLTAPAATSDRPRSTVNGGIGSITFCGECAKKVVVTKYTPTVPSDGSGPPTVLCPVCAKLAKIDTFASSASNPSAKKKQQAAPRGKRAAAGFDQKEDDRPPTLAELAVRLTVRHLEHIDALGQLSRSTLDHIARILSKLRILNGENVKLLFSPAHTSFQIYDATGQFTCTQAASLA